MPEYDESRLCCADGKLCADVSALLQEVGRLSTGALQKMGDTSVWTFYVHPAWAHAEFLTSGDDNLLLHAPKPEGREMLLFAGIIAMLSNLASKTFPGFMVMETGAIKMHMPVTYGINVRVIFECVDVDNNMILANVTIRRGRTGVVLPLTGLVLERMQPLKK